MGMTGEIKVIIKEGTSKDPRYSKYAYWALEVTGEDGTKTILTPDFDAIDKMIVDILTHETVMDIVRKRKPDNLKWRKFLSNIEEHVGKAQAKLSNFDYENLPEIYRKQYEETKKIERRYEENRKSKQMNKDVEAFI
jgi:hypothetical protein